MMASVVKQFLEQARLHPERIAVLDSQGAITYDRMNNLSAYLAEQILDHLGGMDRRGRVALLLPRARAFVVAQFAVLRAGCAIVPIDAEYPAERVQAILEDVGCALCVTVASLAEKAAGFSVLQMPGVSVQPEDLAYCIYTSGSTGRPKGVMIEHRNLANYVHRNEKSIEIMHYAAPGQVNLALASFSFDVSVVEQFVPLCNGTPVVIATEVEIHDPTALARLVKDTGPNGITCTPTYLLSLLEIPESREAICQMQFFDIGSEAFPRQLYDRLRALREDSVTTAWKSICSWGLAGMSSTSFPVSCSS